MHAWTHTEMNNDTRTHTHRWTKTHTRMKTNTHTTNTFSVLDLKERTDSLTWFSRGFSCSVFSLWDRTYSGVTDSQLIQQEKTETTREVKWWSRQERHRKNKRMRKKKRWGEVLMGIYKLSIRIRTVHPTHYTHKNTGAQLSEHTPIVPVDSCAWELDMLQL